MTQWNEGILRRWVSPEYSNFDNAEIPDLSEDFPESRHWIVNNFLNSALGTHFTGIHRKFAIGVILRAHRAFSSYHLAKRLTEKHLLANEKVYPSIYTYFDAVFEWENFSIQTQISIDLFNKINKTVDRDSRIINPKENSREKRICVISNTIKHSANFIFDGNLDENETAPLWLSNTGLHTFRGVSVSYIEASMMLRDIAEEADRFQIPAELKKSR